MGATRRLVRLALADEAPVGRRIPRRDSLSPDDMLVFAAVVREGGVRRGAVALRIPRSTVSRQLALLERALGGRLVARSTRRFELTELGRTLFEQCGRLEEVLKTTSDALARNAAEPAGMLRVAASPIVGEEFLPEVIAAYLQRYPRSSLEVSLSVEFVDLRRGGFDLAIRTGPLQEAGDLFAVKLGNSIKGLYASPGYLKAHGTPLTPSDLSRHNCILVGEAASGAWAVRSGSAEIHVPVSGSLRVDSYRLARSAAVAGIGIARIPEVFARPLVRGGELVPLLERTWQGAMLYAVHAAGQPPPPKIKAFIEVLRDGIRRHL